MYEIQNKKMYIAYKIISKWEEIQRQPPPKMPQKKNHNENKSN